MKTILYNPIFINPQAYFVFPQLYDIEKGDSFIEPAAYAGQLMIENLTDDTKVMLENNVMQVDFTQFAGKRIRINQYTNIGAVVLGEWNIPEDMSGPSFHKSLVDAWFMSGLSNSDKPSSIRGVKGNEIVLKNFAYSLSSGFGKYEVDFTIYNTSNVTINSISIHKEAGKDIGYATLVYNQLPSNIPSYSIKIKGINTGYINYYYRNNEGMEEYITYKKDGIYKIPTSYKDGTIGSSNGFEIATVDEVTITQLPSAYEGALVFDGVDDYGICTGLPIMTDYTVICRREIINKDYYSVASKSTVFGKGAFIFELIQGRTNHCYSFAADNQISLHNSEISWQTKNSYNGSTITVDNADDTDTLTLGIIRVEDESRRFLKGAIYYFALYNKSLTIEEIETEKERLNKEWLKHKTE